MSKLSDDAERLFKDQILIIMAKRLGGTFTITLDEVNDDMNGEVLHFELREDGIIYFNIIDPIKGKH